MKKVKMNISCDYCDFNKDFWLYKKSDGKPKFTKSSFNAYHGVKIHIGIKHKDKHKEGLTYNIIK